MFDSITAADTYSTQPIVWAGRHSNLSPRWYEEKKTYDIASKIFIAISTITITLTFLFKATLLFNNYALLTNLFFLTLSFYFDQKKCWNDPAFRITQGQQALKEIVKKELGYQEIMEAYGEQIEKYQILTAEDLTKLLKNDLFNFSPQVFKDRHGDSASHEFFILKMLQMHDKKVEFVNSLTSEESTQDGMALLPVEIFEATLRFLDFSSLACAASVSKSWKAKVFSMAAKRAALEFSEIGRLIPTLSCDLQGDQEVSLMKLLSTEGNFAYISELKTLGKVLSKQIELNRKIANILKSANITNLRIENISFSFNIWYLMNLYICTDQLRFKIFFSQEIHALAFHMKILIQFGHLYDVWRFVRYACMEDGFEQTISLFIIANQEEELFHLLGGILPLSHWNYVLARASYKLVVADEFDMALKLVNKIYGHEKKMEVVAWLNSEISSKNPDEARKIQSFINKISLI